MSKKYLEFKAEKLEELCAWLIRRTHKVHKEFACNEFEQITGKEIDGKGIVNWRDL